MDIKKRALALLVAIVMILSALCSCTAPEVGGLGEPNPERFEIAGEEAFEIELGLTRVLIIDENEAVLDKIQWSVDGDAVTVDGQGVIMAVKLGVATVTARYGELSDSVTVTVVEAGGNNGSGDTEGDGNGDGSGDSEADDFGSEYPVITIAEALEIAAECTSGSSSQKYYIIGTVSSILSLKNGEMYVYDQTGSIYIYRSTYNDGSKLSATSLATGDRVIIHGTLRNYKGTLEVDNGSVVEIDGKGGSGSGNTGSGGSGSGSAGVNSNMDGSAVVGDDPYSNITKDNFYKNYSPATSYSDAYYRTLHGFLSGEITVPDAAPKISAYQPKIGGSYVKNSVMVYLDGGNTYVVYDAYGYEAFRVYRGAAYITLEEVAAHMYAFGVLPANHSASKNTKPQSSAWGKHLRVNHTKFTGNTSQYPYEPELPDISGCGGALTYYEMDIGTTGTDTGNGYAVALYNDGSTIVRGAARIVYTRQDKNRNGVIEPALGELYLFYTYNHYNDFQEYLNYAGGWGEMFGNVTGGGKISDKNNCNPTPYVPVVYSEIRAQDAAFVVIYPFASFSKRWAF